jgi:hypothetical protein
MKLSSVVVRTPGKVSELIQQYSSSSSILYSSIRMRSYSIHLITIKLSSVIVPTSANVSELVQPSSSSILSSSNRMRSNTIHPIAMKF